MSHFLHPYICFNYLLVISWWLINSRNICKGVRHNCSACVGKNKAITWEYSLSTFQCISYTIRLYYNRYISGIRRFINVGVKSLNTIMSRRNARVIFNVYVSCLSQLHSSVFLVYGIFSVKSDFSDILEDSDYGIGIWNHLLNWVGPSWSRVKNASAGTDPVPVPKLCFIVWWHRAVYEVHKVNDTKSYYWY
jgi:hypothetical protein